MRRMAREGLEVNDINVALNAVEWWRVLVVGFLLGLACMAIGIWVLGKWAETRPYMPGPFARPDIANYRLMPPSDKA